MTPVAIATLKHDFQNRWRKANYMADRILVTTANDLKKEVHFILDLDADRDYFNDNPSYEANTSQRGEKQKK